MSNGVNANGGKLGQEKGDLGYSIFEAVTTSLLNATKTNHFNRNVTSIPKSPLTSMAVIILIIVASLSLVVGAIYLLIYFKSIKPMSARSRSYVEQGGKTDDEGGRSKSAHPFFRRK